MEKGTCRQGVYARHKVDKFEGLVVGKVIWMFGCEKVIIMPKEIKELYGMFDNYGTRRIVSEEYLELTGEKSEFEQDFPKPDTQKWFGKKCRDKVTGIEGICVACTVALFSADQYLIEWRNEQGHTANEWFDEGRLIVVEEVVHTEEVASPTAGGSKVELPALSIPEIA